MATSCPAVCRADNDRYSSNFWAVAEYLARVPPDPKLWEPMAEACLGYSAISAMLDAYLDPSAFGALPDVPEWQKQILQSGGPTALAESLAAVHHFLASDPRLKPSTRHAFGVASPHHHHDPPPHEIHEFVFPAVGNPTDPPLK